MFCFFSLLSIWFGSITSFVPVFFHRFFVWDTLFFCSSSVQALFGMGYMHQMGKGVPQDLFLAKRYFDQAAVVSSDAV